MIKSFKPTVFENIASNFDFIFQRLNDLFLKVNPRSFIDLVTVEDDYTMVMRDGTLLTAIKIHGSTRDILHDEYVENLAALERSFQAHFQSGEHYFSFTFKSDIENIDNTISNKWTAQALETAKKLDLDLADVIQEMHDVYAEKCHDEEAHLLVWTNEKGLSKPELRQLEQERNKAMKGVPRHREAQPFVYTARGFFEKHRAICEQVIEDFSNIHINTGAETCKDFIRSLRVSLDETFTDDNWEPRLIGDKVSLKLIEDNNADLSGLFHKPIAEQILPRGMEHGKEGIIRSGDVLFAPLSLEQHPKDTLPFDALYRGVSKLKIPFRFHMILRHDGMALFGMKVSLARILSFTGSDKNKQLLASYDNLRQLRMRGEEIVSSQISFCTWSRNVDDITEIRQRKFRLAKVISSWGSSQVSQAEGDEVESLYSSIGGVTLGNVAPGAAAPLYDSLKMAPLARMGSAWEQGSKLYRTPTGKLLSYMPYSKQQLAWVKFIVGGMGSGKTVHLNGEHFALLLHPDNEQLPYIMNIDIGPGMKGFCDMVRDALPKDKKHLVIYEKLLNAKEKAINIFDLPLGLRYPLTNQRAFEESFLKMVCCLDDSDVSPDGTEGVISTLIDLVYSHRANRPTARDYRRGLSPRVDEVIEHLNIHDKYSNKKHLKWLDVTDFLAANGEFHLASIAQRYASPYWEDLISKVNDSRITKAYPEVSKFVLRKLTEAVRKYPIISGHTKFDIGQSKIVSLDLDDVAKGAGKASAKRLSLMNYLAYFTLTKRIFTGKEHLDEMKMDKSGNFPFDYTDWHVANIAQIERSPKRFGGDEIHRFENDPMAKELQKITVREGRKWKVDIVQASQLPEDFDPKLIKLATDIVILGRGNRSNIEFMSEYFKLPSNLKARLETSMRKPSKDGSTMIMLVETDRARYEQFVISMYGPSFLWATTSTQDDRVVREELTAKLGTSKARKLLVELYPDGNLDSEIDERRRRIAVTTGKNSMANDSVATVDRSDDTPQSILDDIITDAMRFYERKYIKDISS